MKFRPIILATIAVALLAAYFVLSAKKQETPVETSTGTPDPDTLAAERASATV